MNKEEQEHKTGLIGEYLLKIRLNEYGVNTGGVDKDTGTDTVMFYENRILTAQVKTGINDWNYGKAHGVHVHFQVKLNLTNGRLLLDNTEIRWRRIDIEGSEFQSLAHESVVQIFQH